MWLQRQRIPATKSLLVAATNDLPRQQEPHITGLDKHLYGSWLLGHLESQMSHIKAV
ncbi:hypothetical protein GGI42DRAFT_337096 [Trichoderma sp. SZMC 28013]